MLSSCSKPILRTNPFVVQVITINLKPLIWRLILVSCVMTVWSTKRLAEIIRKIIIPRTEESCFPQKLVSYATALLLVREKRCVKLRDGSNTRRLRRRAHRYTKILDTRKVMATCTWLKNSGYHYKSVLYNKFRFIPLQ